VMPGDALDLAALAIAECERVHRASDMRAGAIAALLERVQTEIRPARFECLLEVCRCDYAAYPGHGDADFTKAARMDRALAAYLAVREPPEPEALLHARANAIAGVLLRQERQDRW